MPVAHRSTHHIALDPHRPPAVIAHTPCRLTKVGAARLAARPRPHAGRMLTVPASLDAGSGAGKPGEAGNGVSLAPQWLAVSAPGADAR